MMRQYWPLGAALVLLAVVGLVAGGGPPRIGHVPFHPGHPPPPSSMPPTGSSGGHPTVQPTGQLIRYRPVAVGWQVPLWVWLLGGGLVLVALAVVVLLAVRSRLRGEPVLRGRPAELTTTPLRPAPAPVTAEQARDAVDAGLAELAEGDPRSAVIACWLRLEAMAEAAGVPAEPADTPTDLVTRLLAGRLDGDSGAALAELAGVYRRARYAPHPVREADRDAARRALARVRSALAPERAPA